MSSAKWRPSCLGLNELRHGPDSLLHDIASPHREESAEQKILICDWLIDHLAAADQMDQYRMVLMM